MTYTYHDPAELSDALALLDEHGEDAHPIAGATAFTLMYRQGLLRPGHVVGLRGIAALGGITRGSDGSLLIGATATYREAERSPPLVLGFIYQRPGYAGGQLLPAPRMPQQAGDTVLTDG